MKYTVVILAALALSACKDERPRTESDSGRNTNRVNKRMFDNVVLL